MGSDEALLDSAVPPRPHHWEGFFYTSSFQQIKAEHKARSLSTFWKQKHVLWFPYAFSALLTRKVLWSVLQLNCDFFFYSSVLYMLSPRSISCFSNLPNLTATRQHSVPGPAPSPGKICLGKISLVLLCSFVSINMEHQKGLVTEHIIQVSLSRLICSTQFPLLLWSATPVPGGQILCKTACTAHPITPAL